MIRPPNRVIRSITDICPLTPTTILQRNFSRFQRATCHRKLTQVKLAKVRINVFIWTNFCKSLRPSTITKHSHLLPTLVFVDRLIFPSFVRFNNVSFFISHSALRFTYLACSGKHEGLWKLVIFKAVCRQRPLQSTATSKSTWVSQRSPKNTTKCT